MYYSFDEPIIKHPRFAEILKLGEREDVIRLMLEDLRDRRTLPWFSLISHVLGYEPVCPPSRDDIGKIDVHRTAFLLWGESAGYL